MQQKKFLITSALPYANGPIHFGHMAGAYLSGDVYNRHRKLQGHKTLFISGSDEHGVAIILNAKKTGQDYQEYVDKWHNEHAALFKDYGVDFDFFGQTSADYHEKEVLEWFKNLHGKGYIEPKDSQQLYCNDCKNHLPDRFVEGTCYKCGFEHARGDECPNCGEFIDPVKLTKTVCKICGSNNIKEVTVTQYYILLSKYHKEFREWFATKQDWRKTVYPYVDSLTKENLHDRAITRDIDWGIDVPLPNCEGKKLYVWFDAPIGYVSNTRKFLEDTNSSEDYLKDWWNNDDVELTHFIGKDNIIFHTIIFPTMSLASGICQAADQVPANQFLNLEGKQFSKSTGHYVDAGSAIKEFGQDALRYYLLSILPEATDSSFSWEQLQAKVNNELANNIGNFLNRCLKFTQKNWAEGMPADYYKGFAASEWGVELSKDILELNGLIDGYSIKKGIEKVMSIGQKANNYFSDNAPWASIKVDKDAAGKTLAYSSTYALCLGVILQPFLPKLSSNILNHFKNITNVEQIMKIYQGDLSVLETIFAKGHLLTETVEALVPKIDKELIEAQLELLKVKK
ncbi:methionine--tRNA ligase [Halobacteriovorax marinus]|uniref:Methionine--tRNA ligase n=1 Tax=Halobacteriovorax marinus TaxID=97084 RepID=A0A1Y5FHN9_9BACT|nr:methionine--tRNA ligase [Halobacteriovorax marinus]